MKKFLSLVLALIMLSGLLASCVIDETPNDESDSYVESVSDSNALKSR